MISLVHIIAFSTCELKTKLNSLASWTKKQNKFNRTLLFDLSFSLFLDSALLISSSKILLQLYYSSYFHGKGTKSWL